MTLKISVYCDLIKYTTRLLKSQLQGFLHAFETAHLGSMKSGSKVVEETISYHRFIEKKTTTETYHFISFS